MTKSPKPRASYPKFIGFELSLTGLSLIIAYFGANFLYALFPAVFQSLSGLLPLPPFLSLTGYGVAYVVVAGVIWIVSNSLLFLAGLRRI